MDSSLKSFSNSCWIVLLLGLSLYGLSKWNKKNDSNIIYNQLSNDNWGTSTDRDTIDEEYKVILTKDSLTIIELVPGSVFFRQFVKDTTIKTITLPLENGGYRSNEYWANLVGGDKKLKLFSNKVGSAYVQATSSIVRIVFNLEEWAFSDTYYFWPSTEN